MIMRNKQTKTKINYKKKENIVHKPTTTLIIPNVLTDMMCHRIFRCLIKNKRKCLLQNHFSKAYFV